MEYYKNEFDKRGFDTMFAFLQMGQQKANIPQLKKAIQDLIKMMTQKSSGRSKGDISWEENFDMTIITIVCESIALYLSGSLEQLEEKNKYMKELLKVLDTIIKTNPKTDGFNNFYEIEETKLKAIRELIRREVVEIGKEY